MSLKTLKDFKQCYGCESEGWDDDGTCCNTIDLKKEAIKWIKNLEKTSELYCTKCKSLDCGKLFKKHYKNGFLINNEEDFIDESTPIINWIVEFFSITKEDLM